MLVAYGVRRDGSRQLLAFLRSQGESQAAWDAGNIAAHMIGNIANLVHPATLMPHAW